LPETILYDLPDSLIDLQTMQCSTLSDTADDLLHSPAQIHRINVDTLPIKHDAQSHVIITSDLNDLSTPVLTQTVSTPKTILRKQQAQAGLGVGSKSVTIHSEPEIIQLQSNSVPFNALSNPCYFAGFNDATDQYDIEQHTDNRVVISIRGPQKSSSSSSNNSSNNYSIDDIAKEATQF
jgi:hypothetical protein